MGRDFLEPLPSADDETPREVSAWTGAVPADQEEEALVAVALGVLRDALGEAREIREEALRVYRGAGGEGISEFKARVGEVVAQLSMGIETVERKLQETRF